jgi:hypothetical protein
MALSAFLPSAQFTLIVGALAASAGLVFAADYVTGNSDAPAQIIATEAPAAQNADWQATLAEIQEASGATLPPPPPQEAYQSLIAAAQSDNLTQSAARTLFINLSNASAQGLGSDIPTQEQIIAAALNEFEGGATTRAFVAADLVQVTASEETQRSYGNAVMQALGNHPQASITETFRILGSAADYDNSTYFGQLGVIESGYRALAAELATIAVPTTLVPLHLAALNNLERIAGTFADMRATPTDPLRGLAGLHTFNTLTDETGRVFTTIAQQLQANAILFTEDEPGAAWSAFLPASL